jgi:uncharacterized protein YdcH (DUF465 family)
MVAKTRHKIWAVKIQHCPISSKFDMLVDYDVPKRNEIENEINESETKRNQQKRNEINEMKRNKTKPTKAKRNQRKQNEIRC